MGLVVVVAIISQKGKGRRCCKSKRASARTGIENLRERERMTEIERRGNDDGEWTYPEGEGGVYSFIAPAGMAASNRGGVQSARRFLGLDAAAGGWPTAAASRRCRFGWLSTYRSRGRGRHQ